MGTQTADGDSGSPDRHPLDAARPAGPRPDARRPGVRDRRHAHRGRAGAVHRRRLLQPAPNALAVLADIADGHFTTEVGAFNLELNLDPQVFEGECPSRLEAQLDQLLAVGRSVAGPPGCTVLTGILPTIRKGDLSLSNMVQNPRYLALNNALMDLRGEAYELHIKGTDELRVRQDSVMAEACNASFQVHLQVRPDEFVNLYNVAQLLAGPVLACATNSPLLFGKRLWSETRIALFEQAVDTAPSWPSPARAQRAVTFGTGWVMSSISELYREDITRFRPVLAPDDHADPFLDLAEGRPPSLQALRLHTGTVWRWNRGVLWRHRRQAAPAHREPGASIGPVCRRRGGQCCAVARPDAGDRRPPSRGQPHAAVRGGAIELRGGRPPRPRRHADVARRRRPQRRRPRPRPAAATRRRGPPGIRRGGGGSSATSA